MMTREEREAARALLSAEPRRKWLYVEAADDGDSYRVSLAAPVSDASPVVRSPADLALRALDTVDAMEAELDELRELLDTLVHWHDRDSIDESWWSAARAATRMRPPAPVKPLAPEQIETLNPGVRKLVPFLRAHGFDTFDSGDGVTHECGDMDLPWPYVHISVAPEKIASEARRLLALARSQGWPIREQTPDGPSTVEAQHFPLAKASEHVAILSLYHVTDADLAGGQS